jgi:hypothetical protein
MMDRVQRTSNSECYTPSSELFSLKSEAVLHMGWKCEATPGTEDTITHLCKYSQC